MELGLKRVRQCLVPQLTGGGSNRSRDRTVTNITDRRSGIGFVCSAHRLIGGAELKARKPVCYFFPGPALPGAGIPQQGVGSGYRGDRIFSRNTF